MKKLVKHIKGPSIIVGFLIIYILGATLLNYIGILSLSGFVKVNFIVSAIMLFVLGFVRGKKASKKGYLEGLKVGSIVILILFILNLIFYRCFNISLVLYFALLLASPMIGSMVGINLRH